MRKILLAVLFSLLMVSPVYASMADCHDLVMSYIVADQDKPTKPGDILYSEYESELYPVLMHTTGYCEGTYGSHGDRMKEGYCAAAPEMYGSMAIVYEAIQGDDGTFSIGDYLDSFEIKDCGYGFSSGQGKSRVRSDKKCAGTIESGLHIDVYRSNLSRCWDWMKQTKGFVFVEIVPAKG